MKEISDPYFERRLATGRGHRVVQTVEIKKTPGAEAESNKNLPNPTVEGTIEDFGWSEKAVNNIIDAAETGKIKIKPVGSDRIKIEFIPLRDLPLEFGHVAETLNIEKNLKKGDIFGSTRPNNLTYLQTVDFAVEGRMDDESEGKRYGRVYVDSAKLAAKRNVYLDPESLNVTDYEYGFSFCVKGGIPFEAIKKIEMVMARKTPRALSNFDESDWPADPKIEMDRQLAKLKEYLKNKFRV